MNLKEKLHQIYAAVDHIDKMGFNKQQSYNYIRSADVTHAIRKQLTELKVYAEVNFEFDGDPYTIARTKDKDAPFSAVNVRCLVIFHDLESGEMLTSSGLGTGADTSDKAAYKAQTGALKYALKNAFLIPDEADPEAYNLDNGEEPTMPSRQLEDEPPSFHEARHAAPREQQPAPRPTQVALSQPTEAATAKPGLFQPAPSTEIPASIGATVAAAPSAVGNAQDAEREPGDDFDTILPTEEELNDFRARFQKLGDDLSAHGKLKSNRLLPINKKVKIFLLQVTKVSDPKDITTKQWLDFFNRVEKAKAIENGLVLLAQKVNLANGIEEKK